MCLRALWLLLTFGLVVATSADAAPVLTYSTYLRDSFQPTAIATDAAGNIYLAGNAVVDPATLRGTRNGHDQLLNWLELGRILFQCDADELTAGADAILVE